MSTPPGGRLVGILIALLGAIVLTITVVDDNGPGPGPNPQPHHTRTVTVTLGGPGHTKLALPPAAQAQLPAQARSTNPGDDTASEAGLHDRTLPTPAAQRQAARERPAGQPKIPSSVTEAAPSAPGCRTAFVRNYSDRHGAPVLLGVLHWTGSTPIPRSDADDLAIVRWFDTPAAQASSNYITDDDGHCFYIVPETKKAWTQAAANLWAVSDEHINIGKIPVFPTAAGRRAILRLMIGWHHRWHLPYRHAIVNQRTCVPIRSGFLAHRDLGPCGGGHPDIGVPSAVNALIREAARLDAAHSRAPSAVDRRTCARLNAWWRRGRPAAARATNVRRRRALERRHLVCTARGPQRR